MGLVLNVGFAFWVVSAVAICCIVLVVGCSGWCLFVVCYGLLHLITMAACLFVYGLGAGLVVW